MSLWRIFSRHFSRKWQIYKNKKNHRRILLLKKISGAKLVVSVCNKKNMRYATICTQCDWKRRKRQMNTYCLWKMVALAALTKYLSFAFIWLLDLFFLRLSHFLHSILYGFSSLAAHAKKFMWSSPIGLLDSSYSLDIFHIISFLYSSFHYVLPELGNGITIIR